MARREKLEAGKLEAESEEEGGKDNAQAGVSARKGNDRKYRALAKSGNLERSR